MTAEEKLEEIRRIYETVTKNKDGSTTSTHAYYNLLGVDLDIEHTKEIDQTDVNTIRRVLKQLADIGKILGL